MTQYISKGWGHELVIYNNELYCGKKLFFSKGLRCSWHVHHVKDETFFLQSGKLLVIYSDNDCLNGRRVLVHGTESNVHKMDFLADWFYFHLEGADVTILEPGDTFHVHPGLRHMMYGLLDTEMFEFSTTHREEDSVRILKGD